MLNNNEKIIIYDEKNIVEFEGITEGILRFRNANFENDYFEVECAVVKKKENSDILRLITKTGLFKAFGRPSHGRQSVPGMPKVIGSKKLAELIPEEEIQLLMPITYKIDGKNKVGYNADALVTIIRAYMKAEKLGVLRSQQLTALEQAKSMLLDLAGQKIKDLIDKATGFYIDEEINALESMITKMYLNDEALTNMARRFPKEYYDEIARMYGWKVNSKNKSYRPIYVAKFTAMYVYGLLPDIVMKKIREKNPLEDNNRRKNKYYHYLTIDTGVEELDRIIEKIIAVMKLSNKNTFKENYKKVFQNEIDNKNTIIPLQLKAKKTIRLTDKNKKSLPN